MSTIIIDLDHTLLNTTAFKQALAKSLDLTEQQWDTAYTKFVGDNGLFNPVDFLQGVTTEQKNNFASVVHKTGKFLYPDSLPFLRQMIAASQKIVVLTFGNQDWQKQKLRYIPWPDGVTVVTTDTTKMSQLAQYMQDDTLVVDDKAQELDLIYQHWPTVQLYWIRRPNGKYRDEQPTVPHQVITSLNEVTL